MDKSKVPRFLLAHPVVLQNCTFFSPYLLKTGWIQLCFVNDFYSNLQAEQQCSLLTPLNAVEVGRHIIPLTNEPGEQK